MTEVALDVIEWVDDTGQDVVRRFPAYGSGEFRLGSQLIVRESQYAVFVRDGKALDVFGPGRHTLETANIPLLASLIALPFGGRSPFRAEVYFVSTRTFLDLKWGTQQPVAFRDPELTMVRLRAYGTFAVRISDARLFVAEVCGTAGVYEREQLNSWMREFIVNRMVDTLGELKRSILDLPMYYDELAIAIKNRVLGDFRKYGLDLVEFTVGAITPPEEVQRMIDQRTSMSVVGDLGAYTQFQTAQAIRDAAAQPGGVAGAGVGLGAGIAMGQAMAQAMQAGQRSPDQAPARGQAVCTACGHALPEGAKFCLDCGAKQEPQGVFCPECGHQNPGGAKFCMNCGKGLGL